MNKKKVALVYDRVNTPFGGAEKVLLALHKLYPNAPLYTSVYDSDKAKWAKVFDIKTSFLQKIPLTKNKHRYLAWLMPLVFETLDLSEYDIIISVTSSEAKGIISQAGQLHVCYLLTPPRYLYSHKNNYLKSLPKIFRILAKFALSNLESWDQVAIHRPDVIIPISNLVKQRAEKYYGVKTEPVIYPSVIKPPHLSTSPGLRPAPLKGGSYFLVISRLVSYKRIDLAIRACQELNKNLIIVGQGPELARLKRLASIKTQFIASANNQQVEKLMQNCQGLIMPGIEDFGITALEVISKNIPVVLHAKSGVAEILKSNPKVFFIKSESVNEIVSAIKKLESQSKNQTQHYQPPAIYDTRYFLDKFSSTIERLYANYKS